MRTRSLAIPQVLTPCSGEGSPSASSGTILLSRRSYDDAVSSCRVLGEQLWSPELKTASIQRSLDYLVYQGKTNEATLFWIGAQGNQSRTINSAGSIAGADPGLRLPVLCTQSAPSSSGTGQDTSERWRVAVNANNEELTG